MNPTKFTGFFLLKKKGFLWRNLSNFYIPGTLNPI